MVRSFISNKLSFYLANCEWWRGVLSVMILCVCVFFLYQTQHQNNNKKLKNYFEMRTFRSARVEHAKLLARVEICTCGSVQHRVGCWNASKSSVIVCLSLTALTEINSYTSSCTRSASLHSLFLFHLNFFHLRRAKRHTFSIPGIFTCAWKLLFLTIFGEVGSVVHLSIRLLHNIFCFCLFSSVVLGILHTIYMRLPSFFCVSVFNLFIARCASHAVAFVCHRIWWRFFSLSVVVRC